MPLDGTELADYEEVIREELKRYGEDDLMQYFDGSESIQEKIQSAVVTIENKDGIHTYVCKGCILHLITIFIYIFIYF